MPHPALVAGCVAVGIATAVAFELTVFKPWRESHWEDFSAHADDHWGNFKREVHESMLELDRRRRGAFQGKRHRREVGGEGEGDANGQDAQDYGETLREIEEFEMAQRREETRMRERYRDEFELGLVRRDDDDAGEAKSRGASTQVRAHDDTAGVRRRHAAPAPAPVDPFSEDYTRSDGDKVDVDVDVDVDADADADADLRSHYALGTDESVSGSTNPSPATHLLQICPAKPAEEEEQAERRAPPSLPLGSPDDTSDADADADAAHPAARPQLNALDLDLLSFGRGDDVHAGFASPPPRNGSASASPTLSSAPASESAAFSPWSEASAARATSPLVLSPGAWHDQDHDQAWESLSPPSPLSEREWGS